MKSHDQLHSCPVWLKFVLGFAIASVVGASSWQQTYTIASDRFATLRKCDDSCTFTLVESIPDGLAYGDKEPILMSTYKAHKRLLGRAKSTIHLATFYWTLLQSDVKCPDNSSFQGEDIFHTLANIVDSGKLEVKIVQNITNDDTDLLQSLGAKVRTLDFTRLIHHGVMHTKMWLVDGAHVYIGSGNFDWRSYTQTKETGVLIENCPCLGSDVEKLFEVYWYLGDPASTIPNPWPGSYSTDINATSPTLVHYNDTKGYVYMSSSPPAFCPEGRSVDIDAILSVIRAAKKYIYISVMDYIPMVVYSRPESFWPIIDDELRAAAIDRKIKVYLMASNWTHSMQEMLPCLKSLAALQLKGWGLSFDVQVKLFTVPSFTEGQKKIPFARVNHNKYMVTDQHAYIGTSNWSGDYFKYTGGIGFILEQPGEEASNLRKQLVGAFERDWYSNYTKFVH